MAQFFNSRSRGKTKSDEKSPSDPIGSDGLRRSCRAIAVWFTDQKRRGLPCFRPVLIQPANQTRPRRRAAGQRAAIEPFGRVARRILRHCRQQWRPCSAGPHLSQPVGLRPSERLVQRCSGLVDHLCRFGLAGFGLAGRWSRPPALSGLGNGEMRTPIEPRPSPKVRSSSQPLNESELSSSLPSLSLRNGIEASRWAAHIIAGDQMVRNPPPAISISPRRLLILIYLLYFIVFLYH
jgi:hypothetical protein